MEQARQNYFRERADSGGRAAQQHFAHLRSLLLAVRDEIRELSTRREERNAQLRETRARMRVRDQEDATRRMEEIDQIIERSTLRNNELKRLLSEKDKLAGVSKSIDAVARLEQEVENLQAKIQEKLAERDDLQARLDVAREARDAAQASATEHKAKVAQFGEQSKALQVKLKAADQAVRDKEGERKAAREEHNRAVEEFRRKVERIKDIEYAQAEIYKEAEQWMLAITNARKRIEPVRERTNPNDERISTGRSLIGYLEEIVEQEQEKDEAIVVQPTRVIKGSKDAFDTVAQLRQPTKKEKQALKRAQPAQAEQAAPKEKTLTHALTTVAQFEVVGERPPTKLVEVPQLIDTLREKVRRWVDEFTIVRVRLDVLPDGKVRIGINLA
jgi:chromosome segregation ATPase